jgi:hypothetical protein
MLPTPSLKCSLDQAHAAFESSGDIRKLFAAVVRTPAFMSAGH